MKRSEAIFGLLRLPVDAAAVLAALLLAYQLRLLNIDLIPWVQLLEPAQTIPPLDTYLETFVLPGIGAFLGLAATLGLYALITTRSSWNEVARVFIVSFLWLVAVIAWFFLVKKQLFYSRMLLLHSGFFIAVFCTLGRASVTLLQRACLASGIGVRSVVSVGREALVKHAKQTLERDVRYRYLGHKRTLASVQKLRSAQSVDLIIQTDPNPRSSVTNKLIEYCRSEHIGYAFLPPVLADNPHQLLVDHLGVVPMLKFSPTPLDGWGRVLKRVFDIVVSLLALLVLSPILLVCALCIYITMDFPIFYISKRVGEPGQSQIPVIKFRTMVKNADSLKKKLLGKSHRKDGPLFKMKNDPRVTPLGRVLRRFSLDELPQLFNVLVGHMSLVGPRPHLPEEVKKYSDYERRVFAVKPGITGLAQVSGRSDLPFKEEVRLDLRYIEEWSPWLDLWILWRTIGVVLNRRGAD